MQGECGWGAGVRGSTALSQLGLRWMSFFLSPLCLWGLTDPLRGPRASLWAWVFTVGLPARHGAPGPRGAALWGQHTQNPPDEGLHGPQSSCGEMGRERDPSVQRFRGGPGRGRAAEPWGWVAGWQV